MIEKQNSQNLSANRRVIDATKPTKHERVATDHNNERRSISNNLDITSRVNGKTKPTIIYPPGPIKKLNKDELYPPTPSILVQNEAEVFSPQLQEFCLAYPITVIRNISRVLNLNLGLFSTKTLVDADADHRIEVRDQLQQPSDKNWHPDKKKMVWLCESPRDFSTIARYASYQATTFQEFLSLSEERSTYSKKRRRINSSSIDHNPTSTSYHCYEDSTSPASKISSTGLSPPNHNIASTSSSRDHSDSDSTCSATGSLTSSTGRIFRKKNALFNEVTFGTNVDLSNAKKWKAQLEQLDKLPMFARVVSPSNMLTHVGHSILGMNTVQLYMKVPGCRTPGHQENNNFCSVNINIGPGDCEWFGVPEEYWGSMAKLCDENNTNFVHGSWWPNLDDLYAFNIPVYRFTQKPGDLVWVNTGTVHWVQAIGWCNNIAWNVGPITSKQYKSAIERYEWNKIERYRSIVPMQHLTWNLARNVEILEDELYQSIRNFMCKTLAFCEKIITMLESSNIEIKWHGKAEDESAHYCAMCEAEVFNILFVKSIEKKLVVHCAKCAIDISSVLESFVVLQEYDMDYLRQTYNKFTEAFKLRRSKLYNAPV